MVNSIRDAETVLKSIIIRFFSISLDIVIPIINSETLQKKGDKRIKAHGNEFPFTSFGPFAVLLTCILLLFLLSLEVSIHFIFH